jgi:prepilin-type processing-associated H-X9-DG protein
MRLLKHCVNTLACLAILSSTVLAQDAVAVRVSFAKETAGKEPTTFVPAVGTWVITKEQGRNVLFVDGRVWKRGQPAGGLADRARELYGARNEEFIESVKAFAYYPIAIAKGIENFTNGEISVRFQMVGGALDRCAGILFNVKPNGDYLTVRFNGTEDNVVLWTFNNGVRRSVKRAPPVPPLELGTWHTLRVSVHGTDFKAFLDDSLALEHTLTEPVSGKVGVWSKTDSMVMFDEFMVKPMPQ